MRWMHTHRQQTLEHYFLQEISLFLSYSCPEHKKHSNYKCVSSSLMYRLYALFTLPSWGKFPYPTTQFSPLHNVFFKQFPHVFLKICTLVNKQVFVYHNVTIPLILLGCHITGWCDKWRQHHVQIWGKTRLTLTLIWPFCHRRRTFEPSRYTSIRARLLVLFPHVKYDRLFLYLCVLFCIILFGDLIHYFQFFVVCSP